MPPPPQGAVTKTLLNVSFCNSVRLSGSHDRTCSLYIGKNRGVAKQVQACGNFQGTFIHRAKGEATLKYPVAVVQSSACQLCRTVDAAHVLHLHKLSCKYRVYALENVHLLACMVLNRYM